MFSSSHNLMSFLKSKSGETSARKLGQSAIGDECRATRLFRDNANLAQSYAQEVAFRLVKQARHLLLSAVTLGGILADTLKVREEQPSRSSQFHASLILRVTSG